MNALIRTADAEFGKALVGEARTERQELVKKAVVGQVTKLLGDIDRAEQAIGKLEDVVKLANRKLKAIEGGSFELKGTTIRYTGAGDVDLNEGMGTEEIIRLASTYL